MFWPGQMGMERYNDLLNSAAQERLGQTPDSKRIAFSERVINRLGAMLVTARVIFHKGSNSGAKRKAESKAAPFRRVL